MIVRRTFEFQAAHHLPNYPGKCQRMHGHSFELIVDVERPINGKTGMVIEFKELKTIVLDEVVLRLDHQCLNDFVDNPTTENMSLWIWQQLVDKLPGLQQIELRETQKCSVVYRGE